MSRQLILSDIASALKAIGETYSIPIVVTNQVGWPVGWRDGGGRACPAPRPVTYPVVRACFAFTASRKWWSGCTAGAMVRCVEPCSPLPPVSCALGLSVSGCGSAATVAGAGGKG